MNLLLLILGRFIGGLGFQMILLEGVSDLYAKTNSVLETGFLGAALFLPTLLLNYSAGLWADRSERPSLVYFVLQMAFACGCGLLFFFHSPTVTVFVFFLLSTVRTLRTPFFYVLARGSGEQTAARLSQLSMVSWQLPLVLGPLLFSVSHAHLSAAGVASILCFVAALLVRGETRRIAVTPNRRAFKLVEFIGLNRAFFEASALDVFVIGSLSFTSLIPYFLNRMALEPSALGYVKAAMSLGALTCLWIFDHRFFRERRQEAFFFAIFLACGVVYFLPASSSLVGFATLAATYGFLDGFSILYRDCLLYSAPFETFGRLSSIGQVFNSASEDLGDFRAGLMGQWLGPELGIRASATTGVLIGLGILAISRGSSRFTFVNSRVSKREIHN